MHQHIPLLSLFFHELEEGLEMRRDVLVEGVIGLELQPYNMLGEGKGVGSYRADGPDIVFAQKLW